MKKYVTHAGNFHADEVFACAVLTLFEKCDAQHFVNVYLRRIRDDEVDTISDDELAFDIGGGKYDHHKAPVPRLTSIIPVADMAKYEGLEPMYSSFGLIWRDYGERICHLVADAGKFQTKLIRGAEQYGLTLGADVMDSVVQMAFNNVDAKLVLPIDMTDNYGPVKAGNLLSSTIAAFNNYDAMTFRFELAVKFAYDTLFTFIWSELIVSIQAILARCLAQVHMDKGNDFIMLKKDAPYIPAYLFAGTGIKYVMAKSNRGDGWNVMSVQPVLLHENTKNLPGCTFMHQGRFIANFTDYHKAMAAIMEQPR